MKRIAGILLVLLMLFGLTALAEPATEAAAVVTLPPADQMPPTPRPPSKRWRRRWRRRRRPSMRPSKAR